MSKEILFKRLIDIKKGFKQEINPKIPGWGEFTHQFDDGQIAAIQAAGLTGRPLLIQGDPGLGKSQLAPALASFLEYEFDSITIHADTEIADLLYRVDHLERLFRAQNQQGGNKFNNNIDIKNFTKKGILWRALAPDTEQAKQGLVILIDEFDKADASIPNALLEPFGNNTITIPLLNKQIKGDSQRPLIYVITSNDERELPQAFIRRCAILTVTLDNKDQLLKIYQCHKKRLGINEGNPLDDNVVKELAVSLIAYRQEQLDKHLYAPGSAEFLDIINALAKYPAQDRNGKLEGLKKVFMRK